MKLRQFLTGAGLRAAVFGTLAGIVIAPAHAQFEAQSDEPVDITGEILEFDGDIATWTGDVRAVQGEAILTAEKLVAQLTDGGDFQTITALGDVRYSNGVEVITGAEAIYDAVARTITMTEDVVVTQGKQVMTGGALVYWIDTGKIRFTAPGGNRIRGIFYTNEKSPRS